MSWIILIKLISSTGMLINFLNYSKVPKHIPPYIVLIVAAKLR